MNILKKSFSLLLTLIIVFSIGATSFADPTDSTDVTDATESSDSTLVDETTESIDIEPVIKEDDNVISLKDYQTAFLKEEFPDIPEINGTAFVLYDSLSKTYLIGDNVDQPLEPASTTKIMTCLLAIENCKMSDIVTISSKMFSSIPDDYVKLGMTEGEEFTVEDLINAALLKSCNDATLALAIHMAGSEQEFCKLMNAKAKELGCSHTNFTTAYGFADPNNLISVSDMALILEACISYPVFSEISTSTQYEIEPTNKYSDTRTITNANRFISTQQYSYDYYIGGKTGYTDTAGNTIVAAAKKGDRTLIGVIFGATNSETRYSDLINLFKYGFDNFTTVAIDSNEYVPIYDSTNLKIQALLANTDLEIVTYELDVLDYHTTTTSRAQTGNTVTAELAYVIINPNEKLQEFDIPLYRKYNDGVTYQVGTIHLVVDSKERSISITPEKHESKNLDKVKGVIITFITICFLAAILILALFIFRNKSIARREKEQRRKNHML